MLAIPLTIACSRYICNSVILHAHPVRGESHSQRITTGEVATTSPHFYNEAHRSHVLCVKAELGTTLTSWTQHHFVDVSLTYVMVLFFTHILFIVNHTTQHHRRGCNNDITHKNPKFKIFRFFSADSKDLPHVSMF